MSLVLQQRSAGGIDDVQINVSKGFGASGVVRGNHIFGADYGPSNAPSNNAPSTSDNGDIAVVNSTRVDLVSERRPWVRKTKRLHAMQDGK